MNKQIKKMYDALQSIDTVIGCFIYRISVPKRFQRLYEEAKEREDNNKKLSTMDKTRLYGYLNPRYHSAINIGKHNH